MKLFATAVLFFTTLMNAQVLYDYPQNQDFYEGGKSSFFTDLVFAAQKSGLKACDKTEALFMRFVIYPDKSLKYVADDDKVAVENNKCLKQKVLSLVKTLDKFKPAEVDKQKVPAIFYTVFTDDMLVKGSVIREDFAMPVYIHKEKEAGIEKFRENFAKCFDNVGFRPVGGDYSFRLNFDVNANGEVGFFYIDNMSNSADFNKMVIKCAANTKKSYWKAGTYKGVKVKQLFRMPLKFTAINH